MSFYGAGPGRVWVWGCAALILTYVAMAISSGWQRHLRGAYETSLGEIRDRGEPTSPAELTARLPVVAADKEMDALLRNLFPGLDLEVSHSPLQESQVCSLGWIWKPADRRFRSPNSLGYCLILARPSHP